MNEKRIQKMYSDKISQDSTYQKLPKRQLSTYMKSKFKKKAQTLWVDVYIDRTHTTHFSTWILDCIPPKTFLNPNSQWKIFFSIFLIFFKKRKKEHFFYFCIKQESMNSTLYLQYPRQYLWYPYSQSGLSFLNLLTKSSELRRSSSMRRWVSLSSSFRI